MLVGSVNPHCCCCKMTTGNPLEDQGSISYTVYRSVLTQVNIRTQMGDRLNVFFQESWLAGKSCENAFHIGPDHLLVFWVSVERLIAEQLWIFFFSVGCEAKLRPKTLVCKLNLRKRGMWVKRKYRQEEKTDGRERKIIVKMRMTLLRRLTCWLMKVLQIRLKNIGMVLLCNYNSSEPRTGNLWSNEPLKWTINIAGSHRMIVVQQKGTIWFMYHGGEHVAGLDKTSNVSCAFSPFCCSSVHFPIHTTMHNHLSLLCWRML